MTTSSGGNGEARYIESRLTDISREVALSAEKHAQAAVILERLSNRLDATVDRVQRLEDQPERTRANITQYGGCSSQVIMLTFVAFDAVIGAAGLIIAIVGLFHKF